MTSLIYIADCAVWGIIALSKTIYNIGYYGINGKRIYEPKHNLTNDDFSKLKEIIKNTKNEPLEIQPETKGITIDTD